MGATFSSLQRIASLDENVAPIHLNALKSELAFRPLRAEYSACPDKSASLKKSHCQNLSLMAAAAKSQFEAPFRRRLLARGRDKRRRSRPIVRHTIYLRRGCLAPSLAGSTHFCVSALATVRHKRQRRFSIGYPTNQSRTHDSKTNVLTSD